MRVLITDLKNHLGQRVTVCGWVARVRSLKNIQFLVLRDHTGIVQITNMPENDAYFKHIAGIVSNLSPESTISVTGMMNANPQVKLGGVEIVPEHIEVIAMAEKPLPLQPNSQAPDRLDWRFLDLRRPENLLVFQVQTKIEQAMREFWAERNFVEIHSPKLMGSASESGAELFEVKYFEGKAYLAQSPQFYKQMAMAAGFDKVFEIGPVFRANPSFTSRHDTEFTSIDVEISWIDSHEDVMSLEEQWLEHTIRRVSEDRGEEINEVFKSDITIPSLPFPRIPMEQARSILAELGHTVPPEYKGDLDPDGERLLSDYVMKTFNHEFVFITDYPTSVRPFYHMRHNDKPEVTKSFDLLWKGLEVTTGAQREHRYDTLIKQAKEKGLSPDYIKFYLDFFRYGMPPHGGYGFGLTRMLMILLGIKNVREVTYLYRGPNRLTP
ncbi:MAG: aspartate--tRNA(Asn) ligase [Patescibacteria group bacterium]|nr:aspartate--tRNA(Asn) ligase [Patescibacteria group bacterium]